LVAAGIEAVRAAVNAPVERSNGVVRLRTDDPQRTLYQLTFWAEGEHVELIGLEATRRTLESVFLELTGEGHE